MKNGSRSQGWLRLFLLPGAEVPCEREQPTILYLSGVGNFPEGMTRLLPSFVALAVGSALVDDLGGNGEERHFPLSPCKGLSTGCGRSGDAFTNSLPSSFLFSKFATC
jgi:hypothetical protein